MRASTKAIGRIGVSVGVGLVLGLAMFGMFGTPTTTPPASAILTRRTTDFCTPGWSAAHRHVLPAVRRAVLLRDHAPTPFPHGAEVDHRVSLELGGSNDISNLRYQAPGLSALKDREENRLHRAVCTGKLSVDAAQQQLWAWR